MSNKIWDIGNHSRMVEYRRVSTEDQEDNNSLKVQLELYERDRERFGWVTIASIEETGSGTSISQREGIKEVLRLVRNGEVDGVYVIDPDRLIRPENLRDLAEIYDFFVENDVKLVTPTRVYDLSIDNDLFSFDIEGVLAKHNRRRLLQNMNRGKIATAKEGKNAGGSAPDGYIVDHKTSKYIFDPDRVEYARRAWDLVYNHDYTLRQLVREYEKKGISSRTGKKWSMTHFHDMFFNEEYLGKYIYGRTKSPKDRKTGKCKRIKVLQKDWIIVENAHEPLVSKEIFYGVQEKLRWRRKRTNFNTHLLTGIATCPLCGSSVHVKFSGDKRKPKYVCTKKKNGCVSRWLDFYDLNDSVWNKFKLILENPSLIEKLASPLKDIEYRLNQLRERQQQIKNEISKVELKEQRLLDLYLDNTYSRKELDEKKDELNKSAIAYRNEYDLITSGVRALEAQPNDTKQLVKYMRVLCYSDTKLSYEQKVRLFRQFVYKVRLDEKLEFDLELYKTPLREIPVNFRSFPKYLSEEGAVKGAVLDGFSDMLGSDSLTACQVTYSSSHLQYLIIRPRR